MGDVMPISALLTATPVADPTTATSIAPALPTGEDTDPFAELLAVVVGAQGAVAMTAPVPTPATVAAAIVAPTAKADVDTADPSIGSDDAPITDPAKADDGKLEDKLAATLSAMLAIAPPPPPPALAAPIRVVLPETVDAKAAPADAKTTAIVAVAVAAAPAVATKAIAPQPKQGGATDTDGPAQAVDTSTDASAPDSAKQAKTDNPAKSNQGKKPATAPVLPAAILRMLREAHATTALSTAPAAPAITIAPVADATAAAVPPAATAAAPAVRDATATTRRDSHATSTRPASPSTARAAQRTVRTDGTPQRAPSDAVALPFADLRQPAATTDASAPQASGTPIDSLVQSQLSIAKDGKWLDSLARDIAASTNGSDLHFKLDPANLGSLTVSLVAQADGTAIRITADTDHARNILTEAQPRLIAEARAQGLRVSETHVELNNNSSNSSGGSSPWNQAGGQAQAQSERRSQTSSPNHLPLQPTRSDEAVDAPVTGTSERYA